MSISSFRRDLVNREKSDDMKLRDLLRQVVCCFLSQQQEEGLSSFLLSLASQKYLLGYNNNFKVYAFQNCRQLTFLQLFGQMLRNLSKTAKVSRKEAKDVYKGQKETGINAIYSSIQSIIRLYMFEVRSSRCFMTFLSGRSLCP